MIDTAKVHHTIRDWRIALTAPRRRSKWVEAGCPVPPPAIVKQEVVKRYAREHGARVLVETGTFMGDMVQACRGAFEHIYTIELSAELAEKARRRFKGDNRITLLEGDSGAMLGSLVPKLDVPALFWLDAHYSGNGTAQGDTDTPILTELAHVLGARCKPVILIDDARAFGTYESYPSIDAVRKFVTERAPIARFEVEHDIIRIVL